MIRKIMTQEELDAKDTKNKRLLAIIIGLVMLFGTVASAFFMFDGNSGSNDDAVEKMNFAGIDFMKDTSGYWNFNVSTMGFQTRYNPQETANISLTLNTTLPDFYNKMLYFGINTPDDIEPLGNSEIIKNIGNYATGNQFSCILANCTEDYPIKNCRENRVIIFEKAEFSSVSFDENSCILLKYASDDEIRVADAFIYSTLGFRTA